MATFYTGVDKERYDAGNKFLPMDWALKNYKAPTTTTEEEEEITTSYGIPNTNAFVNSGGGKTYYSPDKKISDFNKAIADRQNKLENPGWIQQQINKFTGGQRPVSEMGTLQYNPKFTRSYNKDTGMTSFGLPYETVSSDLEAVSNAGGAFGEMPVVPKLDERLTSGIPLGVGSLIARAMPDKYYSDFTVPEQALTQMYMGYTDQNNMGNKDPFGINVRSMTGNYAEYAGDQVTNLNEALKNSAQRFSDKHGVSITFNEATGQFESDNEDALNEWNRLTNNMQTRLGHYGKVTQNFNALKNNYASAKKQRAAWEKETAREQDWADKRFKDTGDYDEYAGAGGTWTGPHGPQFGDKDYADPGADAEENQPNSGASYSRPGMEGAPPGRHHWADGGRVGLKYGGLLSMLGREGFKKGGRQDRMGGTMEQTAQELREAAPDQFGGGMTIGHGSGGDNNEPPTVAKDNFTVDTDFMSTHPSMELMYSPSEWANIRARLYNEDITSEDDINFEGELTGSLPGNVDFSTYYNDQGVGNTNVNWNDIAATIDANKNIKNISLDKNIGDFNLKAATDLDNIKFGATWQPNDWLSAGATTDNMGNTNFNVGAKWEFGKPEIKHNAPSYQDQNPDLIYGLRNGGLVSIL